MKGIQLLLLFVTISLLFNCDKHSQKEQQKPTTNERPVYKVIKTKDSIVVDGKMEEVSWQHTEARSLDYFYKGETNNTHQKTIYRMQWDDEHLYLFFECEDEFITARETQRDGKPFFDDCAELFLIPAPKALNTHIALEVNLNKAKNDVLFINDFEKDKNIVAKWYNPNYDVGVTIDGTVNDNSDKDNGWTMEFKIPFNVLWGLDRAYPVKSGAQYMFLAIRQDRNTIDGEKRSTTTIFPVENIATKDVHQPTMFGLLQLVD
ncbi:carbohydrate-binding family 9-like protein [Seonamhaeicola marinus]|uniref:Carbohydrate-binding domain-containing protein n=1 Tax=Seonamhaeicola marinus TaxID=1912246 RepID=A0A5D0IL34_9FLAO|nr:carbohydrate-binding family 9-like protein [Seonamhaeicola marinus]TYA84256.1 hypothetical protein FUA24_06305 [Seonamhaeicola marinus]